MMSGQPRNCPICGSKVSSEGCTNPACALHSKYFPLLGNLLELVERLDLERVPRQEMWLHIDQFVDNTKLKRLSELEDYLRGQYEYGQLFESALISSRVFDHVYDRHTAKLLILLLIQNYIHLARSEVWSKDPRPLSFFLPVRLVEELICLEWNFRAVAPIPALESEREMKFRLSEWLIGTFWKPRQEGLKDFFRINGFDAYYEPVGVDWEDKESYYNCWFLDLTLRLPKRPGYLPTIREIESQFTTGLQLFLDTLSLLKGWEIKTDFIQFVPMSIWWEKEPPRAIGSFLARKEPAFSLSRSDLRVIKRGLEYFSKIWAPSKHKEYVENMYLLNALEFFRSAKKKGTIHEKLIDYIVSLEALYTVESGEVTEKLAKRCSVLLGTTAEARLRINEDIRNLYNKRSRILHGELRKVTVSKEDVAKLDRYVRGSILAFLTLSNRYPREHIIDTLNRAILDNKERTALQRLIRKKPWGNAIASLLSEKPSQACF